MPLLWFAVLFCFGTTVICVDTDPSATYESPPFTGEIEFVVLATVDSISSYRLDSIQGQYRRANPSLIPDRTLTKSADRVDHAVYTCINLTFSAFDYEHTPGLSNGRCMGFVWRNMDYGPNYGPSWAMGDSFGSYPSQDFVAPGDGDLPPTTGWVPHSSWNSADVSVRLIWCNVAPLPDECTTTTTTTVGFTGEVVFAITGGDWEGIHGNFAGAYWRADPNLIPDIKGDYPVYTCYDGDPRDITIDYSGCYGFVYSNDGCSWSLGGHTSWSRWDVSVSRPDATFPWYGGGDMQCPMVPPVDGWTVGPTFIACDGVTSESDTCKKKTRTEVNPQDPFIAGASATTTADSSSDDNLSSDSAEVGLRTGVVVVLALITTTLWMELKQRS